MANIPIEWQRMVRDALIEVSRGNVDQVTKKLQRQYPAIIEDIIIRSNKKGSNQFGLRGRVDVEVVGEEFDKLENGVPAEKFSGKYTQNVRKHKREVGKPKTRMQKIARTVMRKKPRTTNVKAHKRIYTDMKPVQLPKGDWIIASGTPDIAGKHHLANATKKVFTDESSLAQNLKKAFS